ncbi:MAG: stage II sporulation protein M [Anaerolineales bacterium]
MSSQAGVLHRELTGAWSVARREIRDQLRDWRILTPIALLTLFFPLLMNFTARQAVDFVSRYGAPVIGDRLIPFLLMVVGFFPISISLVIALESFAGERERLSLEPLLATPLSDSQLYYGKMIASLVPPLSASYLGIAVYLSGLVLRMGWTPTPQLLIQILALTTIQAMVMVSGAVVISSQTTSVRAANLLASFIIIPVAELIIGESLIMFWGRYHILWWIVVALALVVVVLIRMGLKLFNREELLGRELDVLDLRWVWKTFREAFRSGATSVRSWYAGLFQTSLKKLAVSTLLMAGALAIAYLLGFRFARVYTLPSELFQDQAFNQDWLDVLSRFGLLSAAGAARILFINVRALLLATLFGIFTFGVLAVILLMVPIGLSGYLAGNLALAGKSPLLFFAALILPHGILEIPAAILSGAAILQLGLALISLPRGSSLGEGWIKAFAGWARINLGIVLPLLIGAALIEALLTPRLAVLLLTGG